MTDSSDNICKSISENNIAETIELLKKPEIKLDIALQTAIRMHNCDIVKLLLADPRIDPAINNNSPIQIACAEGVDAIVELLLKDSRVDPSADNNKAIQNAASYNHVKIAEMLLADSRVDPSIDDNVIIQSSAARGHAEMVKLLLQSSAKVDPASCHNAAIQYASSIGNNDVIALLMADPRVDAAADNHKALRLAIMHGHKLTANLILDHTCKCDQA